MPPDSPSEVPVRILPPPPIASRPERSWSSGRAMAGLVWCEWYQHSRLLLFFLAAWLASVWVLPLAGNPAWILLFGAMYALVAGPIFGGGDTIDGVEEFSFALPPTRGERYLARLAVGGGGLLAFTALDLLALGLDLPQVLAKLYVDSGLIRPWPVFRSGMLYGLVVTLPLAIFAFSFVLSALTHSRGVVWTAWFWSALLASGALQLGFWYEDLVWENLNGYFSCPLLAVLAGTFLWAGSNAFARKEIGRQSAPFTLPARWWLWMILFLLGLLLAMTLTASLAKHYPRVFATGG